MTDLVRRALLGDTEAQKECTAQGIALPCPMCGGKPNFTPDYFLPIFDMVCECGVKIGPWQENERNLALAAWNTRAKPPVGECGTCQRKHLRGREWFCEVRGILHDLDDFCSYYEPREAKEAQKCKDLCKDL